MTTSGITVIGADDPLGEAVIREALVRGLEVVATAPLPDRVPRLSPALRLVRAEPHAQEDLAPAIAGTGTVVLALSPRPDGEPTMRRTDATLATVRAMREVGAHRLVAASSIELGGAAATGLRGLTAPVRRRRHHGGLQDLRRLEQLLTGSGTDWTVLRAGTLTDLLGTRRQQVVGLEHGAAGRIAREDLAHALVDQAQRQGTAERVLAVTA